MEELLLELVTAGLLAVIGWIDGRTMEIPYALSGALAICALADFFLFPGLPVGERLMGMVCVSVPMYTLCMVVKEAFGGGDILLLSIKQADPKSQAQGRAKAIWAPSPGFAVPMPEAIPPPARPAEIQGTRREGAPSSPDKSP